MVKSSDLTAARSRSEPAVEHRSDVRRQAILDTATKLFAEQGFRETNLNQIALELGFRRQAVYHYFPAKDEILYELVAQAGDAMTRSSDVVFASGLAPAKALIEIVRNHVRVVLSRPDIFRIQFSELGKMSGERAESLRQGALDYVRRIADVIEQGQAAGVFFAAPPMMQALLVVGLGNSTTDWYDGTKSRLTVDEIAEYTARMAVSGLTSQGPAA